MATTEQISYSFDLPIRWNETRQEVINIGVSGPLNPLANFRNNEFEGSFQGNSVKKTEFGNTEIYEGEQGFVDRIFFQIAKKHPVITPEFSQNWLKKYEGCVNTKFHKWNATQEVPHA